MASITDYVKEGLKYPFNDGKKVLIFGAIFLASSIISILMNYLAYDSLLVVESTSDFTSFQSVVSAIPPGNVFLIVLSCILIFVLMLLASGYIYNVIKYSIEKRSELPEFKDIKGLLLNGIRTLIVGIAYSIPPALVFILGMILAVNENVGGAVNSIGVIIIFLALVFAIFISLVEVMAIGHMVANDELKAAFRFKEIIELIKSIGWGKYFGVLVFTIIVVGILSVFLQAIAGAISGGLSILIGSAFVLVLVNAILISLFINPYVSIVVSRVYGSLYGEAKNGEIEIGDVEDEKKEENEELLE